jgi:quinolinate synthase
LAHYYVPDDVQGVADYIGDSFYLSKIAKNIDADLIVFAGVSFMGESAKILNPKKKVLLPDRYADCAMAHMASVDKVKKMREQVEDLAVVCYINSTAELKAVSDVCVTSSNAVEIVKKLSNKNIFFIPDGNLGAYVASKVPEKNIICNDGYCPIHRKISVNLVIETKRAHPNALFLVHPECSEEVTNLADFVGSTSEIIKFATNSEAKEFIIGTENGELNYTREGCHSKATILFHEDITGKEITRNLLKAVQKLPNVHILEYVTMLDLIEQDNTCFGILAKDKNDEYLTIEADNTI